MLQFNELRVTQDDKRLIIDTQVEDMDYYKNIYLDSIYIDTYLNFMEAGPSCKSIIAFQAKEEENIKLKRLCFDIDGIGHNMLYFVYVLAKGEKADGTPCSCGKHLIIGAAYNKYPLYKQFMYNLKELEDCNPSDDFINNLLRLKAFEYSLKAGNYTDAIKYWKWFFTKSKHSIKRHGCGCHGRNR